jgi:hypothetical protein
VEVLKASRQEIIFSQKAGQNVCQQHMALLMGDLMHIEGTAASPPEVPPGESKF